MNPLIAIVWDEALGTLTVTARGFEEEHERLLKDAGLLGVHAFLIPPSSHAMSRLATRAQYIFENALGRKIFCHYSMGYAHLQGTRGKL